MACQVTCPFCGLACGDLVVSDEIIDTRGCARAAAGFARGGAARRSHSVDGKPASFDRAVSAATSILRQASTPLFHGLTADLHGVRALLAVADRVGGVVDHMFSPPLLANAAVARASGWVTATFAEVANRADVVVLVGSDPQRSFPRFHERLTSNPTPLYREKPPYLAYIGPERLAPDQRAAQTRAISDDHLLLSAVATLSLLLRGRRPRPEPAGLHVSALAEIAGRLRDARYAAIVWDLSAYDATNAELIVEYVADILRHLNAHTRCVGLPLGGSGNAVGGMQVALWQTGWPLRVGFADGVPSHDPWRYDGARVLAGGETDAVVWTAALAAEPPPATVAPVIALIADDVDLVAPAAVEIRVGIPGIDHSGEIVRSDAVIAVPLQATRASDRPSVADVARAILAKLDAPA